MHLMSGMKLCHERDQFALCFRRVTVPLDGSSSSATMKNLMKDDSYTFCELPRVNPNHKVLLISCVIKGMNQASAAYAFTVMYGEGRC